MAQGGGGGEGLAPPVTVVAGALLVAGWLAGTWLLWRVPRLPANAGSRAPGAQDHASVRVSVVVPARDEARRLPGLLASLAAQDHPPHEVVVVDDGSSDGTAAVAAASYARVVRSHGPAPGWTGKTWACALGVAATTGDVLVLLDADVRLVPDALGRLVAHHAAAAPDGLLSVQPFHETVSHVEQLSAFANVASVMASGIAAARPATDGAVAFGPCLVCTPAALRDAGGFAGVRGSTVEDIALAAAFRAAGRRVRVVAGADAVSFRMYDRLGALVRGWTKNLAGGARRAPLAPTLGTVLWVAAAAQAAVVLVGSPGPVTAGAYLVFVAQLTWMLRRLGRFRWWTSALYPVPLAAFVALFTASVVARLGLGRVTWAGRRIEVRAR